MLLRKAAVAALVVVVASLTLRAEILEQVLVKVNGEIFTKTDPRAAGRSRPCGSGTAA